ncbi:MAG TPA: hypothetical protein VNK41_01070, partial [Vicinamibacterales bacterium]|nr:hypothetical protein [Vicinamibacterales bacterium]
MVSRVLSVQIAVEGHDWDLLRALARESAQFANACLADYYATALGYTPPAVSVFRRMAGRLSGDVRVAVAREAFAVWRKHRARILSGAQRLACFDADRVLTCRAEHLSKGRRQRHAWIVQTGDDYALSVPLLGHAHGGRQVFAIVGDPRRDDYLRPVLDGLASGALRLLKVTMRFERPGRKVFALLTYASAIPRGLGAGTGVATLGPLEADGTLWLRFASGPPLNLTPWIHRLVHMKEHFSGIHRRLRARTRRSGPGHRQAYRAALVKAGSFEPWAQGELHRLSALIVGEIRRREHGSLAIGPLEHA